MQNSLVKTDFSFKGQSAFYRGKVRDLYTIDNKLIVMVVTDRISAFDVVLPKGIPYKGEVLNRIAAKAIDSAVDIVPNWKLAIPDPNVMIGVLCEPFKVEMVIRGYLSGHAWREYKQGKRIICGVPMPDGMKENDRFPQPIITPTTKAHVGHDEDISKNDIISSGLVSENDYDLLEKYTLALFKNGSERADKMGLILVDTKYEFGKLDDKIYLIDELHTPDSSRYFYKEGYDERQLNNTPQKQLSKEFVREWLIDKGFQGNDGQQMPNMDNDFVNSVSDRYIELFENFTGEKFVKSDIRNIEERVKANILNYLDKI